jgi:CBS domain-containing protein
MHVADILKLKGNQIFSVAPEASLTAVVGLMVTHDIRYLPIRQDGRLLGVLSFHDVARAALKAASLENRALEQYIKNWPEPDSAA